MWLVNRPIPASTSTSQPPGSVTHPRRPVRPPSLPHSTWRRTLTAPIDIELLPLPSPNSSHYSDKKITHDKTKYPHHALETGILFPSLTDYSDTFSTPLTHAFRFHRALLAFYTWSSSTPREGGISPLAQTTSWSWRSEVYAHGQRLSLPCISCHSLTPPVLTRQERAVHLFPRIPAMP